MDLEVPTNTQKRIDIVVSKDGLTIDLELATLDMYADLRHSYFATDVPDRAKTIMLDKIYNQISHYAKERSNPIILILNLTHAPDADLYGIIYALHGGGVDNIVTKHGSRIVNRFTTFERDPDFMQLKEGKKISALMQCSLRSYRHYKTRYNQIKTIKNDY